MKRLTKSEMSEIWGNGLGCRDEDTCIGCHVCMLDNGAPGESYLCMKYAPACQ